MYALRLSSKLAPPLCSCIIYERHGGDNQRFKMRYMHGKYVLFSEANGGSMEVPGGSQDSGINIAVSQPNNTPNEYWDILPVEGQHNLFYIRSFCGKFLDVSGGDALNEV